MKPLILTEHSLPEFRSGIADLAIDFLFRFVSGPLPSPGELASYLGARSEQSDSDVHWSAYVTGWDQSENESFRDLGLAEFCQHYETVELWFDTNPSAQLQLLWLLDYFRSHPEIVGKLRLRLVDLEMIGLDRMGKWKPPAVPVTERELATASAAWQAYRLPTPEACFALLGQDLSALPLLRLALRDLLEELPSGVTGLGATEMRFLELIARGYSLTNALFYLRGLRQTRVFNEWEHADLLDGLAFGPIPAVAGLDEALRTLDRENLRERSAAYQQSRLSLTDFGKAVVAHQEDFSRHNPIDRWWGATHLTNDRLWRWNSVLVKP